MTTLGDLIGSIASSLHSYTGVQEPSTHLTSAVSASVLALPVNSSDQVMRGIVEIDDELIYVDVSDANSLAVAPYGRGYRGSVAATHAANTQVIVDPTFPRCEIRRAIDQTILGLYPQLFQVVSTDLTYLPAPVGYALPAGAEKVLDVKYQVPEDPTDFWTPVYNYSFDSTSPEASGKALNLFDWLPTGSIVRVVYQSNFSAFSSTSDTLASVGLKEDWADLITYAVTSRMVRFLDPARLQIRSVENVSRAQAVADGDAGKVANQLYAMYQQRLGEERKKLLDLVPPRLNFQR